VNGLIAPGADGLDRIFMTGWTDLAVRKLEAIVEGFFWMLPNFGFALLVLGLFAAGAWAARASTMRVFRYRGRPDLGALLGAFAKWSILAFGLLVVATIVFPSIRPADALATLGIGSIAVGFAFKDILQNWIAGLLILWRRPFRRGDQIVINDYEGTVEHIEARATILKSYDGRRVLIPNSDAYTRSLIINTAYPTRRSQYDVGIGFGDDIETARRVILQALCDLEGVEREPPPEVIPWELDSSSVNLRVRWWTQSPRSNVVAARGRVIAAIKRALNEAAIDMPFPTRVVLFHDQTEDIDGDRRHQREGWPAGDHPPHQRRQDDEALVRDEAKAGDMQRPLQRRREGSSRLR
jgi:small-conductance mechanosensitive channel